MSLPEIYCYFALITPEEDDVTRRTIAASIEKILGVEIAVEKSGNEFAFTHKLISYHGFDTAHYFKILLDKINPIAMAEVISRFALELHFNIAVYVKDQTPSLNFNPRLIQRVADLGATFDIDMTLTV